jgi:hypothetical protein
MSLPPQPIPPVPEETARVARTAFPPGNLSLMMRDELGTLFPMTMLLPCSRHADTLPKPRGGWRW